MAKTKKKRNAIRTSASTQASAETSTSNSTSTASTGRRTRSTLEKRRAEAAKLARRKKQGTTGSLGYR